MTPLLKISRYFLSVYVVIVNFCRDWETSRLDFRLVRALAESGCISLLACRLQQRVISYIIDEKVTLTKILADLLADRLSQQYAHVPKTSVGIKITISYVIGSKQGKKSSVDKMYVVQLMKK